MLEFTTSLFSHPSPYEQGRTVLKWSACGWWGLRFAILGFVWWQLGWCEWGGNVKKSPTLVSKTLWPEQRKFKHRMEKKLNCLPVWTKLGMQVHKAVIDFQSWSHKGSFPAPPKLTWKKTPEIPCRHDVVRGCRYRLIIKDTLNLKNLWYF